MTHCTNPTRITRLPERVCISYIQFVSVTVSLCLKQKLSSVLGWHLDLLIHYFCPDMSVIFEFVPVSRWQRGPLCRPAHSKMHDANWSLCTVSCYSTVQYSTVQYSTVQQCALLQFSTVQYSTVHCYSSVMYSTALWTVTVQYSTVQYRTVHCYSSVQYSIAQWTVTVQ